MDYSIVVLIHWIVGALELEMQIVNSDCQKMELSFSNTGDSNDQMNILKSDSKFASEGCEIGINANKNSPVSYIRNHYLNQKEDVLFQGTLSNKDQDLQTMFHNVKFVCMGGPVHRMKIFAENLRKELGLPVEGELQDLIGKGHRYSMFKVGRVLCVNHGMGFPSIMILLHDLIKLMQYAKVRDPIFIRTGTSGGFNVSPGTVVIANQVVNDFLEPCLYVPSLGKMHTWPCSIDQTIAQELKAIADQKVSRIPRMLLGRTMSVLHFYEGTAIKTAAINEHSDEERNAYFERLKACNILCVDMEALALGAITHKVGIRAAFLSVVMDTPFDENENIPTPEQSEEWEQRPGIIAAEYIKRHYNE